MEPTPWTELLKLFNVEPLPLQDIMMGAAKLMVTHNMRVAKHVAAIEVLAKLSPIIGEDDVLIKMWQDCVNKARSEHVEAR